MKNSEFPSLEEYLSLLKKEEPTECMMRWMKFYDKTCDRSCCYSNECGIIRCTNCQFSFTKFPPSSRIQCIECPILDKNVIFDPRPEICENCFNNDNFFHPHTKWLKVNEKGIHSFITRNHGIRPFNTLKIEDLEEVCINGNLDYKNTCNICFDEFETNNPPVKYPGCSSNPCHGAVTLDKEFGFIDSHQLSHSQCLFKWYKASCRLEYCGAPQNCDMCKFLEEVESWRNYFIKVREMIYKDLAYIETEEQKPSSGIEIKEKKIFYIKKAFDHLTISLNSEQETTLKEIEKSSILILNVIKLIRDKLIELHPQEWLRKEIKQIFNDNITGIIIISDK